MQPLTSDLHQRLHAIATSPRLHWLKAAVPAPERYGDHSVRAALTAMCLRAATTDLENDIDVIEFANVAVATLFEGIKPLQLDTSAARSPSGKRLDEQLKKVRNGVETFRKSAGLPEDGKIAEVTLAVAFETLLQSAEYAAAGFPDALSRGANGDLRGTEPAAQLVATMEQFVGALSNGAGPPSVDRAILAFYRAPSYLTQMRMYPRIDVRRDLIGEAQDHGHLIRRRDRPGTDRRFRVVDAGCGLANLGVYIGELRSPAVVTRIDLNADVLHEGGGTRGEVTVNDVVQDIARPWPLPSSSQDLVILGEVLEHLFDPMSALREAVRVLRADGQLMISIPNGAHWSKIVRFVVAGSVERSIFHEHIRHFSKTSLLRELRKLGFRKRWCVPFHLQWNTTKGLRMAVPRLLSRLPYAAKNYFILADLETSEVPTAEESLIDQAREIVAWLAQLRHGKILPMAWSPADTVSPFQTAFCYAAAAGFFPDSASEESRSRTTVAALLLAIIESETAEFSPWVRENIVAATRKDLFTGAITTLPERVETVFRKLYEAVSNSSEFHEMVEWFAAARGKSFIGNDVFELTPAPASQALPGSTLMSPPTPVSPQTTP